MNNVAEVRQLGPNKSQQCSEPLIQATNGFCIALRMYASDVGMVLYSFLLTYWPQLVIADGVIVTCTAGQHQSDVLCIRQICFIMCPSLHVVPVS